MADAMTNYERRAREATAKWGDAKTKYGQDHPTTVAALAEMKKAQQDWQKSGEAERMKKKTPASAAVGWLIGR